MIKNKKVLLILLSALILGGGGVIAYKQLNNPRHNPKEVRVTHSSNPGKNNSDDSVASDESQAATSEQSPPSEKTGTSYPAANLYKPKGSFVSSHHAGPDTPIESVCSTSPGATCYISFSKGGIIKSLSKEKTDSQGNVYWTWKPKDIDLTSGTWTIKATAVYKGQVKTATDAMKLEVGS